MAYKCLLNSMQMFKWRDIGAGNLQGLMSLKIHFP